MSVSLHLLSRQSKGLFHGAICQSGPATATTLAFDHSPVFYTRYFIPLSMLMNFITPLKDLTKTLLNCTSFYIGTKRFREKK
jgi:hypothetical protein